MIELKNENRVIPISSKIFKCINTTIFPDDTKENIKDSTRIGYVSEAALINNSNYKITILC